MVTALIDRATARLTIEGHLPPAARARLQQLFGDCQPVNCGRPVTAERPAVGTGAGTAVQVARIYHGSVVEGPGRRSVVQFQGCSIRCPGCYLRVLWDVDGGTFTMVDTMFHQLMSAEGEPRDGVTILGGEPLDQPVAVLALLRLLKVRGIHTTLYTGRTLGELLDRIDAGDLVLREILKRTDLLVDGPFIAAEADGAGEYRGSRNQNVIASPGRFVDPYIAEGVTLPPEGD